MFLPSCLIIGRFTLISTQTNGVTRELLSVNLICYVKHSKFSFKYQFHNSVLLVLILERIDLISSFNP